MTGPIVAKNVPNEVIKLIIRSRVSAKSSDIHLSYISTTFLESLSIAGVSLPIISDANNLNAILILSI